jgi:uncharacterized protein (DUF433 family)
MQAARTTQLGYVDDLGRTPVIRGTNIKVSLIASEYEHLDMAPDEIVEAHPHLTLAQVHAALSYYYDHPDVIHNAWRQDDAMISALRSQYPSRAGKPS